MRVRSTHVILLAWNCRNHNKPDTTRPFLPLEYPLQKRTIGGGDTMKAILHPAARLAIAAALLACAVATSAQPVAYPNRPIHVIVPYPPGGAIDPLARTY